MHEIEMSEVSEEFAKCWKAAGIHIQNQAQGGLRSWLKADLNPPFLEHLSFRLGNQLFFVRIIGHALSTLPTSYAPNSKNKKISLR